MAGHARPRVALVAGGSRYENVRHALELLSNEIDLRSRSLVLIKPNMVSTTIQLAATHRDAIHALLEFTRSRYNGRLIIAEGTGRPAQESYENFGYTEMAREYKAELVDLSQQKEWVPVQVYDADWKPMALRYYRLVARSDYRISITPPKTHDYVIVTLSLKNLIMGSLFQELPRGGSGRLRHLMRQVYQVIPPSIKYSAFMERLKARVVRYASDSDRVKMHQGYAVHHLNLFLLGRTYPPHLSIIDGYQGMEGDGPSSGTAVDWGIAIASQDPVAADCLAAQLMGFKLEDVGYLYYAVRAGQGVGDKEQMDILGADPKLCIKKFQPHPTFSKQLAWRDRQAEKLALS